MSDSHTTATPETTNAAPTAHLPVRENQMAIEGEVEQGAIAGQRVMRAVGGGSPETPPEQFAGALAVIEGRSQTGMLRQLQRSYGNSYVGAVIQRKADGNGACADCEKKEKEIQRKGEGEVGAVPDGFEAAMQRSGTGHPLDEGTRSFMESRFGQDFGDVQVHTDSSAAEAAKQIEAQAFTTERNIYFGRGYYQPQSHEGQKLIAHELTHTVQQRNNVTSLQNKAISSSNDAAEREAEAMSESLTSQMIAPVATLTNAVLQRQEDSAKDSAKDSTKDVDQIAIPAGVIPATGLIKKIPPGAGTETITFEGVLLSTNTEFARWQLEQMIVSSGENGTESFVNRLVQTPQNDQQQLDSNKKLTEDLSKYAPGDVSGAPLPQSTVSETEHRIQNQDLTRSIAKVVQSEFEKLQNDNKKTLSDFEHEGEIALSNMLTQSELRVMTEASHYGIPPEVVKKTEPTRTTAFPAAKNPYDIKQQNANQQWEQEYERRRELQGAASRKKLIEAAQALQKKQAQITKLKEKSEKTEPGKAFPTPQTALDVIPLINAQEEYNQLRREKEAEFPILAVYAQEGGNLGDIVNPSNELKNVLAGQLAEKFEKIQKTETYVSEGTITIWDVPVIVEGARVKLKIDRGTMQWRVIQDKANSVAQAKQDAKETKEAIGTIALILGLLAAVPTGGGSLAVVSAVAGGTSAVLGAYVAGSDLQEYMVQSAASGSDFDRARAISQNEPSLFWVALGVAGSILDVGMALKAFRALSGLRRAVVAGEHGAEALLRAEGNRIGKQLGDRMVKEVEGLGKAATSEAKGAAQIVDKEVLDTAKLAEAAVEGVEKHEIIVTKNGAFRCSKKCGNIFWLYQDVLDMYPSMKPRLEELVKLGEPGASKIAAMTQRMDRLREISLMSAENLELALKSNSKGTVLGDHLRFEKYRRSGGVLEYENWFVQSQEKIVKGEEIWGELSEELKFSTSTTSSPKGLTPQQTKQVLAEAKAIDTAESVAGNYRGKFSNLHPDFPGGKEWQVHHSIPQKFRETLRKAKINVDGPAFLRGVRTTPGELSNVHAKITTHWQNWHADFVKSFGRQPTAAEIIEKAKEVDWRFGHLYWEVEKAAGIPVPTKIP
ncbi:MAG: DUF4157 domain-containing protein [Nostoc sp.]|uniref:eCIS core domain-containing protein n=1 Tax=Nostoc sp. TaxID=1180 RepID=UPI002FF6D076